MKYGRRLNDEKGTAYGPVHLSRRTSRQNASYRRGADGLRTWLGRIGICAAAVIGGGVLSVDLAAQVSPVEFRAVGATAENRWTQVSTPGRIFRVMASPDVPGLQEGRMDWLDNERILFTGATRAHCAPKDDRCPAKMAVQTWTLGGDVRPLVLAAVPCVDTQRQRIALLPLSHAEPPIVLMDWSAAERNLGMRIEEVELPLRGYRSEAEERMARARFDFSGLAGRNRFSCGSPIIDTNDWSGVFAELHVEHGHLVWIGDPTADMHNYLDRRKLAVRSVTGEIGAGVPVRGASSSGLRPKELAYSAFDKTYYLTDISYDFASFIDTSGKRVDVEAEWRRSNCRKYWVFSHQNLPARSGCVPFVENGRKVVLARDLAWVEARERFRPRNSQNGLHWFEPGQPDARQAFRGLVAVMDVDRGASTSVSPTGCRTAFAITIERTHKLLVVEHC